MKTNRSVVIAFLLTAMAFSSCVDNLIDKINNIEDLRWNPDLAVPLGGGSFSVNDFIEDLEGEDYTITSNEDGLLVFNYAVDEAFSTTASDLIEIEDETHEILLQPDLSEIPDLSFPVTGTFPLSQTHEIEISPPDGDKLYQLNIKEGLLEISAVGTFPGSGELDLTFEHVTKNDIPLVVEFEWTYNGTNSQRLDRTVNLREYEIDYTDNGTTENYLSFTTDLTVTVDNQIISLSDGLDVDIGFRSLEFAQVIAHIQPRAFSTEQYEMVIEFMEDVVDGNYYFDEPEISINIDNSFGVPLQIAILELVANSVSKGNLNLEGTIADAPQSIGYPSMQQIGQSVSTAISINHENSNLPSIISWQPDTILYTFEGSVRDTGTEDIHFILDNSRIEATLDMQIPWIGRIEDITFKDTIDFDGSDIDDIDEEIAHALFRLTTRNGFPVNATVQAYFISDFGVVVDSLFHDDNRVLEAGQIGENGNVTDATVKELDVVIEGDRLAEIASATSVLVTTHLNTPASNSQSVRFHDEDQLAFTLFVQTQFDIVF